MNKPTTPTALDADWVPADNTYQYAPRGCVYSSGRNCRGLARNALKERIKPVRKYRRKHWERVAKAQRVFAGILAACGLLAVLALLVR